MPDSTPDEELDRMLEKAQVPQRPYSQEDIDSALRRVEERLAEDR